MFFVVRSNDIFNFPLGLIKYIAIVKSGNEQEGGGGCSPASNCLTGFVILWQSDETGKRNLGQL